MRFNIKKLLPKKILGRLLIIFFLPLICIQCLAIFLFYDRHWEKITTRFANIASNQINLVIENYINNNKISKNLIKNLNIKAKVIESYSSQEEQKLISFVQHNIINTLKSRINHDLRVSFKKDAVLVFIFINNEILELSLPKKYLVSETPLILFLWVIFSSILLSLIAFLFMRIQVRAITRLAKYSEEFGMGEDSRTFKPEGAIEIKMAGKTFIKMKRRIQNQIKNRTNFLAGISHDLGTILTRIKLQLELASNLSDIKKIKKDINSMEILLSEYLQYSKNADNSFKIKKLNLKNFLYEIIESSKKSFKKIIIELECNPKIMVSLSENNLSRIFSNILNNACKFGKKILVTAKIEKKKLIIDVEDDGPGIPDNIKNKIFRPFFKMDTSRNLNYVGSGLGLSIAKEIISKINGRILVKKSRYKGSCFRIIIPIPYKQK